MDELSSQEIKPPLSPSVAIVFGILAASTSSILIRFAQLEASSLVIAAYRLGFASLLLVPFMLRQPRNAWPASRRTWGLGTFSGIFLALHFAAWISSLEYTTVASSVVLVQTAPLFVAVLSPFFLRESPTQRAWIGLIIAFAGGVIIAFGDSCTLENGIACPSANELWTGTALTGDLLALIGGLAGAAYLIIGREVRSRLNLIPYVSIVYGSATVVLIAWALLARETLLGYEGLTYVWFLLLALLPQLLAHTTYNWALKYLPATSVSLSLLGEPISAAVLAWLILNESVPLIRIFGGVVVLTGILFAVIQKSSKITKSPLRE